MIHLAAFAVAMLRVYLRAAQTHHVLHYRWLRVPPFSYGMSMTDVFLWGSAGFFGAEGDVMALIAFGLSAGTGGWLGAWIAMYCNERWEQANE